jgi:drug/metabolite transporter (DMT)-like permease
MYSLDASRERRLLWLLALTQFTIIMDYLVPVVTAIMDFLVLGNRLAPLGVAGMASILGGLVLVFRAAPVRVR